MMLTGPKSGEQNEIKNDSDRNTKHIQPSSSSSSTPIACPPKVSWWKKAFQKLRSTGQISEGAKGKAADTTLTTAQPSFLGDTLSHLIKSDISHIHKEVQDLEKYNSQLKSGIGKVQSRYEEIKKNPEAEKRENMLKDLRKNLMKVKLTIPKYKTGGGKKNEHDKLWGFISEDEQSMCGAVSMKTPELHKHDVFETSTEFKDFEARFVELEYHVKLCLLCFSIFPQDAIIKKRLMLQWWVVEGYATTEKDADEYFKELLEKGFIEPVNNNRSRSVGSCRVHPFHHSALVALAERAKLFNFEHESGNPTQNFSGTFQACLMGAGLISYEDFKERHKPGTTQPSKVIEELTKELEKLHLLINVDEHILEFVDEWFSKMSNLNILYLGRWKASAIHHIEVEDSKFLEKLGDMKYVKFLSLQGVSNIISLPRSMRQLTNLDILDLRACSNLESIPDGIGYLEMLTHLDMSECYLLAHMPKSLSELKKLKVLKGFVIGEDKSRNKCTLRDLQKLEHLEKLCIYTDQESFHEEQHVADLKNLRNLTKLTITWGVSSKKKSNGSAAEEGKQPRLSSPSPSPLSSPSPSPSPLPSPLPSTGEGKLPPKLKKLDLKCFPWPGAPDWLKLENLKEIKLEKLYIRGGKFSDLGQYLGSDDANKWTTVKELRLKYLGGIKMEWRQLQELFPKLEYLEKVSCPNLTLFPCDAKGVWIKPQ